MQHTLHHLKQVPSTNRYLLERADTFADGTGVFTTQQTDGYGRFGRPWQGVEGDALAFSLLYKGLPREELSVLPLIVGIAVANLLRNEGIPALLKWSNDIILENKKLGGILCESRLTGENTTIVIGIGLNLNQSRTALDSFGLSHATSLQEWDGMARDAAEMAQLLLAYLAVFIQEWLENGFVPNLQTEYKRLCSQLGSEVRIVQGANVLEGVALTVALDGRLVCRVKGKLVLFSAGDVSLRGADGAYI